MRKDVTDAQKADRSNPEEKQEQRNRIKPDDDFMEASGIRRLSRNRPAMKNLRKALSEDDFLKMFEEELGEDLDQSDDFIREFEDEITGMNWNTEKSLPRGSIVRKT